MGFMRPKAPVGPSPQELQQREEAARQRERDRIAQEDAARKADEEQKALTAQADAESKRKAFAGALTTQQGDENERKKYLKGV